MKKILIIIEQCMQIQQDRNSLINEYVNLKKDQGYQIDIIGDTSGVMRDLLDEKETSAKEMTGAQADVLFDLNRYENAIYVPANAKASQDILVYKPDDLDKNMIFYNIGNMNIVPKRALEKTREENLENLKGFVTPSGDYTDNIERNYTPEGIVGDAYDKPKEKLVSELSSVFNEPVEKVEEKMESAKQSSVDSIPAVSTTEKLTIGDVTDKKKIVL